MRSNPENYPWKNKRLASFLLRAVFCALLFTAYNTTQAQQSPALYKIIRNLYNGDGTQENSGYYLISTDDWPGCNSLRVKICMDGKRLIAEQDGEMYYYYRENTGELLDTKQLQTITEKYKNLWQNDFELENGLQEKCAS